MQSSQMPWAKKAAAPIVAKKTKKKPVLPPAVWPPAKGK